MSDPFEVEVKKGTFSLSVKGLKPMAQVGQYLADAVGVVGEPLGIVKDSLANYRVYRQEAALLALKRGQEIADEKGETIKNISPKVLAPWLEGASSEDPRKENLLELWATLLACEKDEFDPTTIAFMTILKSIGPKEAEIMANLVSMDAMDSVNSNAKGTYLTFSLDDVVARNMKRVEYLSEYFLSRDYLWRTLNAPDVTGSDICPLVEKRICGRISDLCIHNGHSGTGYPRDTDSLEILCFAGAVERANFSFSNGPRRLTGKIYSPTVLGAKLFRLINQDRLFIDLEGRNLNEVFNSLKYRKVRIVDLKS